VFDRGDAHRRIEALVGERKGECIADDELGGLVTGVSPARALDLRSCSSLEWVRL